MDHEAKRRGGEVAILIDLTTFRFSLIGEKDWASRR